MKKTYTKPVVEFIHLECEDIITCSNGFEPCHPGPGPHGPGPIHPPHPGPGPGPGPFGPHHP